jgi:hypothetical protein
MQITVDDDRETILGRSTYSHQLIIPASRAVCRHGLLSIICGSKMAVFVCMTRGRERTDSKLKLYGYIYALI